MSVMAWIVDDLAGRRVLAMPAAVDSRVYESGRRQMLDMTPDAIERDVLSALAEGPSTAHSLAWELQLTVKVLRPVLSAMVARGQLEADAPRSVRGKPRQFWLKVD